jgi:hypothetical protein
MRDLFQLGEKYRLDFSWDDVIYVDNTCKFVNACFSGPVLQFAEKIESNNFMLLDFFKQYFILVDNVYIGKLSWGEVIYNEHRVNLVNCILTHESELHKVPKLEKTDILIIDCKQHERETHAFYTTYKTYVSNKDLQVYNFIN